VVAPLARQYRESPTPTRRDALLRLAAQYPRHPNGALALLAVGVKEVESGEYAAAVGHLEAAESRLSEIPDYLAYYLGLAYAGLAQYGTAARRLDSVSTTAPFTPLAGRAAAALAKTHLAAGAPQKAVAALLARYPVLPQPEGDLTLAYAHEAAGALVSAATYAQRVYFGNATSNEAEAAGDLLGRLRQKLGSDYPPPLPEAMLARAGKWLESGNHQRARKEYEALASELGGAERELAQVRSGAARFLAGPAEPALRYLSALTPSSPEADAERLYYLVQCARRLERPEVMQDFTEQLRLKHPNSAWCLSALVWAGNYYVLRNEAASYAPLFRACYEGFPSAPGAEYCYWKVAWNAYIERRPEAAGMLREHLQRFPQGEKAPAALYFLGRLTEASGEEARTYYREIVERFPNSYYVQSAEERLSGATAARVTQRSFEPGAAERQRIRRAQLLYGAGLTALADGELRHAARGNGNAHVLALELARQADERNKPDQGIRHIKGAFARYLSVPLEAAPLEFWRLAFPLPYRASLQQQAKTRDIDLYLLAGLIRQESEFGAEAVSRAGARGLMQVLPSTGRGLSSRLKVRGFRASSLFNADLNIRLGSFYLRSLLDQYDGNQERALAAYNGGKQRVDEWLTWGSYREPAEFIESIPISETRTYVQAVLRNAWMYRRIYAVKDAVAAAEATAQR
jgi:soluble lytic murein transglycosylase